MITKTDLILLLTQIEQGGEDVSKQLKEVMVSPSISLDVLKFINDRREISANTFYDHIRQSYNKKRSNLYKNIVRENPKKPSDILTTLASLNLQILLYCEKLDEQDKIMFLQHMRFNDINKALYTYGQSFDLTYCQKLLQYIKSDLKAFESIRKND